MASAAIDTNNIHQELKELSVNDEQKDKIMGESHSPDQGLGKSLPISEISTSDKNVDEPKKGKKIVVISRGVSATVKWFNGGFGFLTLEGDENAINDGEKDSKDIFFHKSSIITTSNYPFSDGYFLRDNDKVVCDVVRGRRNKIEAIALSGPDGIQIKAYNRAREYRRRVGGNRRMITNESKAIENDGRDREVNNRREAVGGRDRPVNYHRKTENGHDREVKKGRGETGRKRIRAARRTPDAEDKKETEKSDETKNGESETGGAPTSGTGGTDAENKN